MPYGGWAFSLCLKAISSVWFITLTRKLDENKELASQIKENSRNSGTVAIF